MQAGRGHAAYSSAMAVGTVMFSLLASACTPSGGSLATDTAGNPIAPTIPNIMADVAAQAPQTPGGAQQQAHSAPVANGTPSTAAAVPQSTPAPSAQMVASVTDAAVVLPEQVAYVPTPSPADTTAATPQLTAVASSSPMAASPVAETSASEAADNAAVQAIMASVPAPVPIPRPAIAEDGHPQEAASAMTAFATPARPVQPQKKGFFALLFGGASTAQKAPAPQPASSAATGQVSSPATVEASAAAPQGDAVPVPSAPPVTEAHVMQEGVRPLIDESAPAKPIVQLASAEAPAASLANAGPAHPASGSDNALPGVRSSSALFEITRKSGTGDDSDVDISEDDNAPVRVASAAGLARLDPHGFLLQRQSIDTACLKPGLVAILRQVEQHFGHKLIVTSGYRSPVHNAAAHGALNSLHMFCAAADVQMPGVSKWQLADYARSLPGRGGVGTYCYTDSVHIDIGPERDWNWRCRRRHRRH